MIELTRVASGPEATLGIIRVDGSPLCFSLEDQSQPGGRKVPGETRIPAGRYEIQVRKRGGWHLRCRRRWPQWHRGMLELLGVPNFQHVLVHPGNTDDHTAGCILPGYGASLLGDYAVADSVRAYRRLYGRVIEAALAGDLSIEICDLRS